jgi:co-chaperonin GroES (HSP10)
MKIRALTNKILCHYIEKGQQTTAAGIILTDDNNTAHGIRPRWMQVYSVGPEVTGITVGQWVMVEHGRWTHGMNLRDDNDEEFILWGAEEESILLVSDDEPSVERSASSAN